MTDGRQYQTNRAEFERDVGQAHLVAAQYWQERAHRAEAENARLREALNDHHQWARTHGHEMGLGYLNSWLGIKTRNALATHPPKGEPSGVKESLTTEAHGDALDRLASKAMPATGDDPEVRALQDELRQALDSAPEVPDWIQSAAKEALDYIGWECRFDHHGCCQEHGLQDGASCFAKRLREIAAAPQRGDNDE